MWVYPSLLVVVMFTTKIFKKNRNHPIILNIWNRKIILTTPEWGFIITFIILALFSAVRDGIGVDYRSYYNHIRLIQNGYTNHYMEIGFQKLVILVAYFSANPRWILIIMSVLTCYFYLKIFWKYSMNITISILIFLSWGYYFFTFNSVRTYFAQAVSLIGLMFLIEKKYFRFFLTIIIASLFHKTALVCIPLYIFSQKEFKSKYKYVFIVVLVIGVALFFESPLRRIFFSFYNDYQGSIYDSGRISWLNIFKAFIVVFIGVLYYPKVRKDRVNQICFNLNIFSLIFYIGLYWTPEISRIGFYMNTTAVFFITRLISSGEIAEQNKTVIKISLVVGSLALFLVLMRGFYNYTIQLLPYKTWIGSVF